MSESVSQRRAPARQTASAPGGDKSAKRARLTRPEGDAEHLTIAIRPLLFHLGHACQFLRWRQRRRAVGVVGRRKARVSNCDAPRHLSGDQANQPARRVVAQSARTHRGVYGVEVRGAGEDDRPRVVDEVVQRDLPDLRRCREVGTLVVDQRWYQLHEAGRADQLVDAGSG